MLAFVVASLPLALAVCDKVVGPKLPADAEQFSPPPVYSTWWQMTEACSGLSGSLPSVTWYSTNDVVYDTHSGDQIAGFWIPGRNQIVIATLSMMDGGIVRHEMLHALRQRGGHPRNQFLGKCGGVVDCEQACVADAEPYTPPSETPLQVNGDGIELNIQIAPGTPTHAVDEGRFSITVLAHNKSTHWVTVMPSSPSIGAQTFSLDIHGTNAATTRTQGTVDPSQTVFAPGETKRHVFDLAIGTYPIGGELVPGDYFMRGGFAGWWSAESSFTIGP